MRWATVGLDMVDESRAVGRIRTYRGADRGGVLVATKALGRNRRVGSEARKTFIGFLL